MFFEYRVATSEDVDSIYMLQCKIYQDTKYHEDKSLIASILSYGLSYVVEVKNSIIGYSLVHKIPHYTAPPVLGNVDHCDLWEALCIHDFAISPEYQRRGVGYMFLDFLLTTMVYKTVTIVALPDAVSFWQRNKFTTIYPEDGNEATISYHENALIMVYKA